MKTTEINGRDKLAEIWNTVDPTDGELEGVSYYGIRQLLALPVLSDSYYRELLGRAMIVVDSMIITACELHPSAVEYLISAHAEISMLLDEPQDYPII